MKKFILRNLFAGLLISLGFFGGIILLVKAAGLTATTGEPLTVSKWTDMAANFFWGSGSGGIYYNGKVGIGTNSPNKSLHIKTSAGTNAELDIQSGDLPHWAIYQDESTKSLTIRNGVIRTSISTGGNLNAQGLCINGVCKTSWAQIEGGSLNTYTGTCDGDHRGYSGIINGYYKMCNGSSWINIVALDNFFAGDGTDSNPYRLNGELVGVTTVSAKSCQYYNANAGTLNNGTQRGLGTCGAGSSACLNNGIYLIDPDGAGGNNAFKAYCDMTTNMGGWTLVVGINGTDATHVNAAAVNSTNLISPSGKGKYSDAVINAIVAAGNNGNGGLPSYKFTCDTITGYFKNSCTFNSTTAAAGDCSSESYAYNPPTYGTAKYSQPYCNTLTDGSSGAANRLIYGGGNGPTGCDTSSGWSKSGTVYVR